jgi:hypothetical protein
MQASRRIMMSEEQLSGQEKTSRSSRRQKLSQLGEFIVRRLRQIKQPRKWLAAQIGVAPSTITRIVNGETQAWRKIEPTEIAEALRLSDNPESQVSRQAFFALFAKTILGVAATSAAAEEIAASIRHARRDFSSIATPRVPLGIFDAQEIALSHIESDLRNQNPQFPPARLLKEAKRLYDELQEMPLSPSEDAHARLVVRSGMLLAALQESVLTWGTDRPRQTTRTYNDLEAFIRRTRDPVQFSADYIRLLLRRAVLFREDEWADECYTILSGSSVTYFIQASGDPTAEVAVLTQRAHTLAVQENFPAWKRAVDRARDHVESMAVSARTRQRLHAIVDYTVGVGYKRFMWMLREDDTRRREREAFARLAYDQLSELRQSAFGGSSTRDINFYHPCITDSRSLLELEASAIDALVWCDPEAVPARCSALRAQARSSYPAVLGKLDRNLVLVEKILGRPSG